MRPSPPLPPRVGSLRFLDAPPTLAACSRLQTFNQFYTCDDVDLDRYVLEGERRTVFAIGREIDYTRVPDFQRRHFTYTHGYGLVIAPVNEIDTTGRPRWIAGGIPQDGPGSRARRTRASTSARRARCPGRWSTPTQPAVRPGGHARGGVDGHDRHPVGSGASARDHQVPRRPAIHRRRPAALERDLRRPGRPRVRAAALPRHATDVRQELAPFLRCDSDPYFVAAERQALRAAERRTPPPRATRTRRASTASTTCATVP